MNKISVIICSYNHGKYVEDAINSIKCQSRSAHELIVVNDGSSDDTESILMRIDDIKVISRSNRGQCCSYYDGFLSSTGDIIYFLDADDVADPDLIESLEKAFSDPRVSKVHWRMRLINAAGKEINASVPRILSDGFFSERLLNHGILHYSPPASGNAYRRSAIEAAFPLPYSEFDRHGADFFLINFSAINGAIKSLDKVNGSYRLLEAAGDNLIFGNSASQKNEIVKIRARDTRLKQVISNAGFSIAKIEGRVLHSLTTFKVYFGVSVANAGSFSGRCRILFENWSALLHILMRDQDRGILFKFSFLLWCVFIVISPYRFSMNFIKYACNQAARI